jgi:hypothetical protein
MYGVFRHPRRLQTKGSWISRIHSPKNNRKHTTAGLLYFYRTSNKSIMQTQTASTRTQGLLSLFDYQTGLFAKALEGISEEDMHNRLNTEANHPAWLAGSLVQQRFMMTSETGTGMKQTGEELFQNHKGLQEGAKYPSTAEYIKDWERITPEAREALATIDDQKLDSEINMGEFKWTYYEMICFTIYREASIIGQLALWRRLLGYPALKYD